MAGLLALVADLLAGGSTLGAVTGEVAVLAAVVALGAVDAVAFKGLGLVNEQNQVRLGRRTAGARHLRDMWPMPPQE